MTANQVQALNYQESKRANTAKEALATRERIESERANRVKERETERTNRAQEEERKRHNKADETIQSVKLGADYMKGIGSLLNPIL